MRITRVATALLQGNFEWLLVRVETDAGIDGLGEAHWGAGVEDAVHRLGAELIGEDARDIDRLWRRMYLTTSGVPWAGAVVAAANGIETALFDVLGRAAGLPIYRLLGGRYRDRIRLYADLHAGRSEGDRDAAEELGEGWHASYAPDADYRPEAYARRAGWAVDRGFDAIKFDLDVPNGFERDPHNRVLTNAHLDSLVEIAAAVRERVGRGIDVAFDCHWHFDVQSAVRLARALEPFDLLWLEDPVPPENHAAMARVAEATTTPICTGENLYLRHAFRELLAAGAADIIEPDFPRSGGFLEFRRIADLADEWYVPVAPHNVGSPIATLAAAHMAAAIPNFLALEFHAIDVPWWQDLVRADAAAIVDGHLRVPEAPGLGVELDEDVGRSHLKAGSSWFGD
jgi:L-alanine-DL-glutamate epimerase-like enolase superfamily enzyme